MANSYFGRLHTRALQDARHAVGLETSQRVMRLVLMSILVAVGVFAFGSFKGLATDTSSRIVTALFSLLIAPIILLVFFYCWNFLCAPARLDSEAQNKMRSLELKIENREERRQLRKTLWELREQGVHLRNRGKTTRTIPSWKGEFDSWHTKVLQQSALLSDDLRHSLDPLDKIAHQEAVGVSDTQHQLEVSCLSEILARLYRFLSETAIQDGGQN